MADRQGERLRLKGSPKGPDSMGSIRRHRPDYWLVIIILLLLAIGMTVIYSISPALTALRGGNYVMRQAIAIALSIVAFTVTARIPLRTWRRWQWWLLGLAALGTLIALVLPPVPAYPQHRWIHLGSFSLQSVEVLKFALIISLSGFLAARASDGEIGNFNLTMKPLLAALAAIGFIVAFIQGDLGSAGVIVVMAVVMGFVAGMPMRRIALVGLVMLIGATLAISSTPYRRARLSTYLHPESNCSTSAGHQACQALIAVGSGGMIGLGLGNSVQAYGYLPEAQNDSIFAIYAEKFGFIGTMVLLGLFVTLFARLRLIAERAPDMFSRLVVVGVLAWLSIQAIINIGAMIGLLPLKGITLPLISYGGTSVLFVGAALGLVFQVSHYTGFNSRFIPRSRERNRYDNSTDGRRIRRTHYADPRGRA